MSTLVRSCSSTLVPFPSRVFLVYPFIFLFLCTVSVVQLIIRGFVLYKLKSFLFVCFEPLAGKWRGRIDFPVGWDEVDRKSWWFCPVLGIWGCSWCRHLLPPHNSCSTFWGVLKVVIAGSGGVLPFSRRAEAKSVLTEALILTLLLIWGWWSAKNTATVQHVVWVGRSPWHTAAAFASAVKASDRPCGSRRSLRNNDRAQGVSLPTPCPYPAWNEFPSAWDSEMWRCCCGELAAPVSHRAGTGAGIGRHQLGPGDPEKGRLLLGWRETAPRLILFSVAPSPPPLDLPFPPLVSLGSDFPLRARPTTLVLTA